LKALGFEHLLQDPRFSDADALALHLHELTPIIDEKLSTMPWEDVRHIVEDGLEGTFTRMLDLAEVAEDEQTRALNAVATIDHPTAGRLRVVNSPWVFEEERASLRLPPPLLGEHTAP